MKNNYSVGRSVFKTAQNNAKKMKEKTVKILWIRLLFQEHGILQ